MSLLKLIIWFPKSRNKVAKMPYGTTHGFNNAYSISFNCPSLWTHHIAPWKYLRERCLFDWEHPDKNYNLYVCYITNYSEPGKKCHSNTVC